MKVVFVQSHPIQYFAPLFKSATSQGLDLEVLYCSDESIRGAVDKQFGQTVAWDIPLLEGYKSKFLKNSSWKPSIHKGFFGLINWGLISELKKLPKCLVAVPGWNYGSYWIAILAARFYGHQVALRGESPLNQELLKGKTKLKLRKVLFKMLLFPRMSYCLYIGERNKQFYKYYGVPDAKLVFAPYSVDNERFQIAFEQLKSQKTALKSELGLSDLPVILFSGKYIHKKRPLQLLKAFSVLKDLGFQLVMVGDGELRTRMEQLISEEQIENVVLTGFINQSEIVRYYAIADVFVMSSGDGETWGLSVNEAMNFHLPVVVSDMAGCAVDLVEEGVNGYRFPVDDVRALSAALRRICQMTDVERVAFGEESARRIAGYSYEVVTRNLRTILA